MTLIVLRSDPMPEAGMKDPTIVRVEFHYNGAKTRLTLSDSPQPAETRDRVADISQAALDKLAAHLAA